MEPSKIVVDFPATKAGWLAVDLVDAERAVLVRADRGDVYIEQGVGRNRVRNRIIKLEKVLRFAVTDVSLGHSCSRNDAADLTGGFPVAQISMLHAVSGPDRVWILDVGTTATPLIAELLADKYGDIDVRAYCHELKQRAYDWVSKANAIVRVERERRLGEKLHESLPSDLSALRSTIASVSDAANAAVAASGSPELPNFLDVMHAGIRREELLINRVQQGVADVLREVSPSGLDLHVPMLKVRASGARPSRILIVDDDDGTRSILVKAITKEGVVVREASSVQDAIEAARELSPDLVLVDLGLPDYKGAVVRKLAGLDVVQAIRENQRDRDVRIVVITGQAFQDVSDSVGGRELEMITKPFDLSAIGKLVSPE